MRPWDKYESVWPAGQCGGLGKSLKELYKPRHRAWTKEHACDQQLPCGCKDRVLWMKRDEVHAEKWVNSLSLYTRT